MQRMKIILIGLGLLLLGTAQAQPLSADIIGENLNDAVAAQQAKVQLMLTWEREVRVQDFMSRPARYKAGDTMVRTDTQTTSCQGVLLAGNTQVAVPAVCLEQADSSLQKIRLTFANGRQADVAPSKVSVRGELGYISLPPQAAGELRGLAVRAVRPGQSLQETFGSDMTLALHRFFTSFGIAFKNRTGFAGSALGKKRLQVGEPVFFEGKLVALVKHIPHRYGALGGQVSEESLALFYR